MATPTKWALIEAIDLLTQTQGLALALDGDRLVCIVPETTEIMEASEFTAGTKTREAYATLQAVLDRLPSGPATR